MPPRAQPSTLDRRRSLQPPSSLSSILMPGDSLGGEFSTSYERLMCALGSGGSPAGSPTAASDRQSMGGSLQQLADALSMPRIAQAYHLVRMQAATSNTSLDGMSSAYAGSPTLKGSGGSGGARLSRTQTAGEAAGGRVSSTGRGPSSTGGGHSGRLLERSASGYSFGLAATLPLGDGSCVSLLEYAEEAVMLQALSQSYDELDAANLVGGVSLSSEAVEAVLDGGDRQQQGGEECHQHEENSILAELMEA